MNYTVEEIFEERFKKWGEEDLEDILDDRFDEWHIVRDYGNDFLEIYVLLNDANLYGEWLDSFLEYQVLGIEFLEDMGLLVEKDYQMEELLNVLPDYIFVHSITE